MTEDSGIAVVGFACRFPGAENADTFWANLCGGVESIEHFDLEELERLGVPLELARRPDFVPAGAGIAGADLFDHRFWGYSPREAALMDPQQRLFLETAWAAVEHAGHDVRDNPGMVGVYAGMGLSTYLLFNVANNPDVSVADTQVAMLGNDKDFLSTRASYHLDLRGPSITVQTGCSTSLVATHLACEGLHSFQCDVALAGGVSVVLPERTGYVHLPGGTASSDGHCRAFDERGDGTVFGSGVGVVVLKRLQDAVASRDVIYAVIKGSAVNNDGANRVGFTAPSVEGQAEVIVRAQNVADVDAATITFVEAHGTATRLGDPVEVAALTKAFRESTKGRGFCALGSVKTNIGHLDAAAGVASLIKTTLALHHKQIPPSLHFESPNPEIDFEDSPFYVNTELLAWPGEGNPRRAGVSAFGFGGTNAHLVLEEGPSPAPSTGPTEQPQLLVLSAKTDTALAAMARRLADHLDTMPGQDLADVAYTLQVGRTRFDHRRALVCRDRDEAAALLRSAGSPRSRRSREERDRRPVAFMFAGIGNQHIGMTQDLYHGQTVFRDAVDACSELLRPHLGLDLRRMLYTEGPQGTGGEMDFAAMLRGVPPDSAIDRTELAHPALFVTEYALAQQLISWGLRPAAVIGHSLGEYVAATVAGVFTLADALLLIARRARLIEELPAGSMVAVPLGVDEVRDAIGDRLSIASVNGRRLTIVAGPDAEVAALEKSLAGRDITVRRLRVRHGFHSPMVEPIVEPLTELVRTMTLAPPRIPLVSNITGDWITAEAATDPAYWGRHSASTVQFAEGLRTLCANREQLLLEIGPGQSLSSLAMEHLADEERGGETAVLSSLPAGYDRRRDDTSYLLDALGQTWLAGAAVDWAGVHAPAAPRRVPVPTYPFEGRRAWLDAAATAGPPAVREAGRRASSDDWFWAPTWRSIPLPEPCAGDRWPTRENWLVLADELGVADQLVRRLAELGQQVTVVHAGQSFTRAGDGRYRLDPTNAGDYADLCVDLASQQRLPAYVVHLWGLDGGDLDDDATTRGFFSLEFLSAALLRPDRPAEVQLWIVSNGVTAVERGDVLDPVKTTLLGAARCIPQEYVGASTYCVDVAPPGQTGGRLATQLLDVIAERPDERLIAYRGDRRWVPSFEPLPLTRTRTPLRPRGGYVLLGGLGRIGLDLADHLAGQAPVNLVLTTRSPFPARERWPEWLAANGEDNDTGRRIRRLTGLIERGIEPVVLSADVTDAGQVRQVLAETELRFGAVNGVVYAAGVGGEAVFLPIDQVDRARCEEVLRLKVDGARVLRDALGDREPDFVLLLSSNAAVLGGIGISAYAASNVFLDSMAQRQFDVAGSRWISVNLEEWLPDQGWPQPVTTSFTRYGVSGAEGAACLHRILERAPGGQITLCTGDLQARLDRWIRHPEASRCGRGRAVGGEPQPRPALGAEFVPPRDDIERAIAKVWQDMLGIDGIGRDDNFYELGGHSLLATQIVTRVRTAFKVELSILDLLVSPTVAGFAAGVRDGLDSGRNSGETSTIRPVQRGQSLPLSYAQRRFWFLDQLEPGNPFYNVPDVVRITGPVRIDLLERSINDIIARHESLRTRFATVDGEPVQEVLPEVALSLRYVDLTHIPHDIRRPHWVEIAHADARAQFDLSQPPLIRATAVGLTDREHILLLTMHHSVSDAWSIGVFIRELSSNYVRHLGLHSQALPRLPIQYADFASWQRQYLDSGARDQLVGYWRRRLAGAPLLSEFPIDYVRPSEQSFRGAEHPVFVPAELVDSIKRIAAAQDCTLFMALLAAFTCLLHRHSGQRDLVVGSPIAGRTRPELEDLIGVFVNMLPLRIEINPGLSFRELLGRVRETTLGAYAHQDLPFELLVEALQPDRTLAHGQIFQNVFVLQNAPLPSLDLAGLRLEQVSMPATTAKFDLMLTLRETPTGAEGSIEYATDLFSAKTIARLSERFLNVLQRIATDPDCVVDDLDVMAADERARIIEEWAHGASLPATGESIPELFSAQARKTPDRLAVRSASETTGALTFAELEARSNQVAHYLGRRGVGRESRVGICLDRTPETVTVVLGVLKSGGAYVPLDPSYPRDHLEFVIADADLDLVVIRGASDEHGRAGSKAVTLDQLWLACDVLPELPPPHRIDPQDPAYVLYTSGSTGTPKGVVGLHGGMVNRLRWMWREYPFEPNEMLCQKTSLNFLDSFAEIFGPLCRGIPIVVIPNSTLLDTARLVATLARHRVTRIVLVPSLLRLLLDTVPDIGERLTALGLWVTSGEALAVDLAERFIQALPGRGLLNLYGASEISADVTYHGVSQADVDQRIIPIGRPISQTATYILDEFMNPVPAGVEGELYVGGAALGRGYVGRPDLTAERFLPDPFAERPGGRLYRTGDRARYRSDGAIIYAGRRDQQVKVRGFRVELAEVERALGEHHTIAQAVVDAEGEILVAYCRPASETAGLDLEALRAFLERRLPYYMVPAVLVSCTEFPLTPSGKIDRARLAGSGVRERSRTATPVMPRNDVEEVVAAIWSELLGGTDRVGVHDNFFALGGYSLLATRFVVQVREAFELDLPLKAFFMNPTVAGVVEVLRGDPTRAAEVDRRAAILRKVAALSDDEVARLLARTRSEWDHDT